MATLTGNIYVFSSQREVTAVMVKVCIIPITWSMTGRAACAKSPIVLIIVLVTGKTISGSAFVKVILMTIFAGHLLVFAFQFKGGEVVIKFIIPVMAGKTVGAKGQGMHLDKDNVHFAVAILAGVGYECCYILSMTVTTNNRFIPHLLLVMYQ